MPIKPENKARYPKNWRQISERIRVERAHNRCEVCGVVNYSWINRKTREICLQDEDDTIRVVLTVAHLDHQPENCDESNLKAMCQKCHNNYDKAHRKETIHKSRTVGQMSLDLV